MSDVVGNTEDRFSRDAAEIVINGIPRNSEDVGTDCQTLNISAAVT